MTVVMQTDDVVYEIKGNIATTNEDDFYNLRTGKKLMSGYNVYRVADGDNYLIVTCVGDNDNYARYKLTKDA